MKTPQLLLDRGLEGDVEIPVSNLDMCYDRGRRFWLKRFLNDCAT